LKLTDGLKGVKAGPDGNYAACLSNCSKGLKGLDCTFQSIVAVSARLTE